MTREGRDLDVQHSLRLCQSQGPAGCGSRASQAAQAGNSERKSRRLRGTGPLSPRSPDCHIRAPQPAASARARWSAKRGVGEGRRAPGTQPSPMQFKDASAGRPNEGHGSFPARPRRACPHRFLRAPWGRSYAKIANQRWSFGPAPESWRGRDHGEGGAWGTC